MVVKNKRQWLTKLRVEAGFATINLFAVASGIKARTIRAWEEGATTPHGPNRIALIAMLGPEAAQKLMNEDLIAAGRLQANGMARPAVA